MLDDLIELQMHFIEWLGSALVHRIAVVVAGGGGGGGSSR